MTNKEFFGDKLLAIVLKGDCDALYRMVHGKDCAGLFCGDCEFGITKESEIENVLQWLNAEHEEPELLENGDGLKPGDWIMVKHYKHDTWKKRQFLCYWNGRFFATKGYWEATSFKDFNSYTIARLPEEGE